MNTNSVSCESTQNWIYAIFLFASILIVFTPNGTCAFVVVDRPVPKVPSSVRSDFRTQPSLSSWSKIVESDTDSGSLRLIDSSSDDPSLEQNELSSSKNYNLGSPREWLEFCESRRRCGPKNKGGQQQQDNEPGDGAYTVLRCDFDLDEKKWRVWGKYFHDNRLKESYRLLLQKDNCCSESEQNEPSEKEEELALDSGNEILKLLISDATKTILRDKRLMDFDEDLVDSIVVVMVTLLWEPELNDSQGVGGMNQSSIRVRGHGFSTMKPSRFHNNADDCLMTNPNAPVQAVIGYLPPAALKRMAVEENVLPNRYQTFPQAKLSSWCRRRRLLEESFKGDGIGDVILAKESVDEKHDTTQELSSAPVSKYPSIELLEGLTSNLFVVYPGNVLRTAPTTDVLGGYVRHLIIKYAEECGYKIEYGRIDVGDSMKWREAFFTSSIRLITPVNRIFLPKKNDTDGDNGEPFELEKIWKMSQNEDREKDTQPPLATNVLYNHLMKQAGCIEYDTLH